MGLPAGLSTLGINGTTTVSSTTRKPRGTADTFNDEVYLLGKDAPSTLIPVSPKPAGYESTDGEPSAK